MRHTVKSHDDTYTYLSITWFIRILSGVYTIILHPSTDTHMLYTPLVIL